MISGRGGRDVVVVRRRDARPPRACDLPDHGNRVPGRQARVPEPDPRRGDRHAAGRGPGRAARSRHSRPGEDGRVHRLPVRARLPGRAAVLRRAAQGRRLPAGDRRDRLPGRARGGVRDGEADGVRPGLGIRAAGRRPHPVGGDRRGHRRDQRIHVDLQRRQADVREPDPGRVRGLLPGRHRRGRVLPVHPRPPAARYPRPGRRRARAGAEVRDRAGARAGPGLPAGGPSHLPDHRRVGAGRDHGGRRGGAGRLPGPADLPAPVPPGRAAAVHRAGHRAAGRGRGHRDRRPRGLHPRPDDPGRGGGGRPGAALVRDRDAPDRPDRPVGRRPDPGRAGLPPAGPGPVCQQAGPSSTVRRCRWRVSW